MRLKNDAEGRLVVDYEGKYPIEPLVIEAENIVVTRAILKCGGIKAPLIDSLKAAWTAFITVRYGQFIDDRDIVKL